MPAGQPLITLPSSMGSGISFNERFRPSQNGATAESLYSLATESGQEVKRQLTGGGGEVPSGVPLMEALASKGMGSVGQRSATMDVGGAGFVYPMSGLPEYSFFKPETRGGKRSSAEHILSRTDSQTKERAATLMPGARFDERDPQISGHRQLQITSSFGGGKLSRQFRVRRSKSVEFE